MRHLFVGRRRGRMFSRGIVCIFVNDLYANYLNLDNGANVYCAIICAFLLMHR